MVIGFVLSRCLRLPSWVTPAICFNNTTSLPLLLIQSLDATGVLSTLLMSDSDTTSAAITRAKSYFLVCSIVSNSLTFALGPKLLGGEDSPDEKEDDKKQDINDGGVEDAEQGRVQPTWLANGSSDHTADVNGNANANQDNGEEATEETSLLPDMVLRHADVAGHEVYTEGKKSWDKLPRWAQHLFEFTYAFLNGPLIGAVIGAIVGLVPSLHRAFFSNQQDGGIFTAWLTSSLKNVGELFASLQVVVVGVKLSSSLRKMKKGEDSGTVPWLPVCLVLSIRFILWPL